MVSRARDASKVALAWLVARLRAGGYELLDCQFMTDHLASLGAVEIARADYMALLADSLAGLSGAASSSAGPDWAAGGADFRAVDGAARTSVSGPVAGKAIVQLLAHTS